MATTLVAPRENSAKPRRYRVGTTGHTAAMLDDPHFEAFWDAGSYEIVEGILTKMPPALFDGGMSLARLIARLQVYVDDNGIGGAFSIEADVLLTELRVARCDAVYLCAADLVRQEALNASLPRRHRARYGRLRVGPTVVIESISPGHEAHDRVVKRAWYAEAGVPHYWLLDGINRTLDCHTLTPAGVYETAAAGRDAETLRSPPPFDGLTLPLERLWA